MKKKPNTKNTKSLNKISKKGRKVVYYRFFFHWKIVFCRSVWCILKKGVRMTNLFATILTFLIPLKNWIWAKVTSGTSLELQKIPWSHKDNLMINLAKKSPASGWKEKINRPQGPLLKMLKAHGQKICKRTLIYSTIFKKRPKHH